MPSIRTVRRTCIVACLSAIVLNPLWAQARQKKSVLPSVAYSGTIWTTTTQPISGGNPVVETRRLIVAQSSNGTVRRESFTSSPGSKHDLKALGGIIVLQVASKQETAILDPRTRIAEIRPVSVAKPVAARTTNAAVQTPKSLGQSTISGVAVVGSRRTYTVSAPQGASSSTAVVTEDTWVSPQLHAVIMTESHDTLGRSKIAILENIQQVEPDASMFSIPSNYTIHRK